MIIRLAPGGGDEIGHQLGGDGGPGRGLTVLAGIGVVGHHRGDAPGRSPLQGVQHDAQFQQVFVAGNGGGLNDVNILAPDILPELHRNFPVGKPPHRRVSQGDPEMLADLFRQGSIGIAGKDF